ncbi:MAG: lipid A export permease/ATP-binding protein MsbA [Deltaproteobacteria bacterium]|nr:MAG: lipid A export permease/ATP-binding protein MsbA [Deltaproteobacteria bacterium]
MKFFTLNKRLSDRHRSILSLISVHQYRLGIAMLCMLLFSATTTATAYLIEPVLDEIFVNKRMDMLLLLPAAVIGVCFFRGLAMYGQEYFMNYVGQRIIRNLRDRVYAHLMTLPVAFFHHEKTGVLMSRITNDVNIIKSMVSTAVTSALRDCFSIILLVVFLFYQCWDLALGAFVILPVAYYPISFFGKRVRRMSTGCQESMADMNAFLHETFAGNKVVKAFNMETYETGRFCDLTRRLFRLELKTAIAKSLSSPVMEFLGGVGVAFIIWFGGSRVIHGIYSQGEFFSFLAAAILLYDPVKKLSKVNNAIQEGLAATDRIFTLLERETDVKQPVHPVTLTRTHAHQVRLENVSFQYDRDPVLKEISLSVEPGNVLALVGMSGGGKSSLVSLIPRFYDVTGGRILLDDTDIRDLAIDDLRSRIAMVTQEPILFNDTIAKNIAYGKAGATQAEIAAAAKAAYAADFIEKLPEGYHTAIGELGSRLSGGEKQRICIARALIKDAPILILDEATSSLDATAEKVVQKALDNLMQGRTTLVIAHRLSTIVNADRIAVIENGGIVETGTHTELMAKQGAYERLYRMQYQGET